LKQNHNVHLITVFLITVLVSYQNHVFSQDIQSRVDEYIGAYMKMGNFSGSVLIAKDDRVLVNKAYGMADYEHEILITRHTKFQIGSMAKQFTAMAIMILQERGMLSVNDPLSKYISHFPNGERITIHHLLTHTSGVPALEDIPDFKKITKIKTPLEETIETLKKKEILFAPGEEYQYSNSGYMLLGYIIEKASGGSYGNFLKDNIFDPLDMKDSGFDDPITLVKHRADGYAPNGRDGLANADYFDLTSIRGAGTLYSTVEDLHKWDRSLYTEKLINKRSMETIFTPPPKRHYGYGWVISKRFDHKMIWHDGNSSGFQAYIARFVDDDACLIVLSNFIHTPMVKIRKDLAAILFGEKFDLPESYKIAEVDPIIYDAYIGKYALVNGDTITVTKENERLFIETLAMPMRIEIFPESETKFFVKIRENTGMTFIKDENGEVKDFVLHFSGSDIRGKKVE